MNTLRPLPLPYRIVPGFFFPFLLAMVFASAAIQGATAREAAVRLSSLDLEKVAQGWGEPHADRSVENAPLSIGGQRFEHGLGTHAPSTLYVELQGGCSRFTARVGVDDAVKGTVSVLSPTRIRVSELYAL